jgi:DNA-binding NarL/FixJ family response regulator
MEHRFAPYGRTAVLLEPHPICHAPLTDLLAEFGTTVVGAVTSAACARALLAEHTPDVLVVEVDLPEGSADALELVSLSRRDPRLTVVVLSRSDSSELVAAALEAGAAAFIPKTADPEMIRSALRAVLLPSLYAGRPVVARVSTAGASPEPVEPRLTRREREILKLVAEGRSNREAGQVLWVTDQTVKFHLANIYRKLGVRNRYDAARWARDNGLLETVETVGGAVEQEVIRSSTTSTPARLTVRRSLVATDRLEETSR